MPDLDSRVKQLDMLLREIAGILLDGHFDLLPAMSTRQAQLVAKLAASGLDRPGISAARIRTLESLAKRNERLLQAAIRGMHSATQRRAEVLSAHRSCQAYDREGRAVTIELHEPEIELRK